MTYVEKARRVDPHLRTSVDFATARLIRDIRAETGWHATRIGIELGIQPSAVNKVIRGWIFRDA